MYIILCLKHGYLIYYDNTKDGKKWSILLKVSNLIYNTAYFYEKKNGDD